jgi:ubiquinone biosynthesis protein UbiJ
MSENYKRLDAVQQEIKDLLKKKTRLRKKEQKGQLDDEGEIELEGVVELLTVLQEQEKFWQGQVDKENKPEETSKSFGEADADWIASVTGVDCHYREWSSFAT